MMRNVLTYHRSAGGVHMYLSLQRGQVLTQVGKHFPGALNRRALCRALPQQEPLILDHAVYVRTLRPQHPAFMYTPLLKQQKLQLWVVMLFNTSHCNVHITAWPTVCSFRLLKAGRIFAWECVTS